MKRKQRSTAYPAADWEGQKVIQVDGDMIMAAFEYHSGGDTSMREFLETLADTEDPVRREAAWYQFMASLVRLGDAVEHCAGFKRHMQGACPACQHAFVASMAATAVQNIFVHPDRKDDINLLLGSLKKVEAARVGRDGND